MQPTPLAVRLPETGGEAPLRSEIKAIAKAQGIPVNQFIVKAIEKAIAEYKASQSVP